MGLDQYAYAVTGRFVNEDGIVDWEDKTEIGYWRKHRTCKALWRTCGDPEAGRVTSIVRHWNSVATT